jgi:hypothetical protein
MRALLSSPGMPRVSSRERYEMERTIGANRWVHRPDWQPRFVIEPTARVFDELHPRAFLDVSET